MPYFIYSLLVDIWTDSVFLINTLQGLFPYVPSPTMFSFVDNINFSDVREFL